MLSAMGKHWSVVSLNFVDLSEIAMFSFSVVLILLQSVKGDSTGLIVHWSMDLHNDVMLMPDYGNETRFLADLPSYSGQSYFTTGVIGEALSLSSQKVNLINNIRRNDCIRNPVKCEEGLSITFWLNLKKLTRKNYQVILRSTSFDASGPGVYVGGDEDTSMMRIFLRTAAGVEYSRKMPWSKVQMKWCHYALKWNSSHGLEVFLNGSSVNGGQNVTHGQPSYPTRSYFTAGDVLGPVFLLDDLWIFYRSLPGDTIHKIYELGLPASKEPLSNLEVSNLSSDNDSDFLTTTDDETANTMRTSTLSRGTHESSDHMQASTAGYNEKDAQGDGDLTPTPPHQRYTGPTSHPKTDVRITTYQSTIADSLPITTFGMVPKRNPPSRVSYMGWFYNQTWYHVLIAMTFLTLLGISTWLCVVHCLLPKGTKQENSKEQTDNMDQKPFIKNHDYV